MFLLALRVYESIIYENDDEFVKIWFVHAVHLIHERCWCIGKTEWHDQKFIMAVPSSESRLWNVIILNSQLVITRP